jgi:hypothetical protein
MIHLQYSAIRDRQDRTGWRQPWSSIKRANNTAQMAIARASFRKDVFQPCDRELLSCGMYLSSAACSLW